MALSTPFPKIAPAMVELITYAQYSEEVLKGKPPAAGTLVIDPNTGFLLGVVDGNSALQPGLGGNFVSAPVSITSANAAQFNGAKLILGAGATLTIDGSAWSYLNADIAIHVAQSASATLAFSGTAAKENASGTSNASQTLAACGVYVVTQSPTGSALFRVVGGASL